MKNSKKILDLLKTLAVIALIVIVGLIFFAPQRGKPIRNVPLLITVIVLAAAVSVLLLVRRILCLLRIKRELDKSFCERIKVAYLPNLFRIKGRYDIVFYRKKVRHNLVVFPRVKSYVRYYCEDESTLERYVCKVTSVRNGRDIARVSSNMRTWKKKRSLFMPWKSPDERDVNILLLDKMPMEVQNKTTREGGLGNGDTILPNVILYDNEGFLKYLKEGD